MGWKWTTGGGFNVSVMTAIGPEAADRGKLRMIRNSFVEIAGGMDRRFVRAGKALASVHDLLEQLVVSLEDIACTPDREASGTAVAQMQTAVDYLLTLPAMQTERGANLDAIRSAGNALMRNIAQIERTLSFLQICGLNLKVASGGAEVLAGFVDEMFGRLEFAQDEVRGLASDVRVLGAGIAGMLEQDRLLAIECAKVIPHVPRKLVSDAEALLAHRNAVLVSAEQATARARTIRGKVADAIDALQIGDITRQRLEHVADGLRILDDYAAGLPADAASADHLAMVAGHCATLLVAQAEDALHAFRGEARLLMDSLDTLTSGAMRLLALRDGEGRAAEGADAAFLGDLERGIAHVDGVTVHLHRASAQSKRLGEETGQVADRLSLRLKAVRKVQRDVAQMAWNTGLRCRNMGQDGQGLAVMSTEIRNFANILAEIWADVSDRFDRLVAAAVLIERTEGQVDMQQVLIQAFGCIRSGGARVAEGLSALGQRAPEIATVIRETSDGLDCDRALGVPLSEVVARFGQLAHPIGSAASPQVKDAVAMLLERMAAQYTMAREREVHRRFTLL
jgi:hypothetical protein